MKRIVAFAYGIACYGVFFATLLYAIGFLGNFGVPKSIDSGREDPVFTALVIDKPVLHSRSMAFCNHCGSELVPQNAGG